MTSPFRAFQVPTAAQLNEIVRLTTARGQRTTSSTTTTTEVGVERLDDVPVIGGRRYIISTSGLALLSTTNNDDVVARVRYTEDGSTPTTSSTLLPGCQVRTRVITTSASPILVIVGNYFPASNLNLSILLCVARVAGSGSVSIFADSTLPIDLVIDDGGEDPGDTGTSI